MPYKFIFSQVIVTVPLSVLKKNVIKFNPPLPLNKQTAIDNLGVGYMEKVLSTSCIYCYKGFVKKLPAYYLNIYVPTNSWEKEVKLDIIMKR